MTKWPSARPLAIVPAPFGDVPEGRASPAPDWQALVRKHDHTVIVSLLARGVPLERARELAQETWLRLWRLHSRDGLPYLELPGLAITQARFLAESDRRRPRAEAGSASRWEEDQGGEAPDEALIARESLARVRRALDESPASARGVFEFVYAHPDLTYAEVAERLGLSVQRVKQVVCEVRKRLRAAMERP